MAEKSDLCSESLNLWQNSAREMCAIYFRFSRTTFASVVDRLTEAEWNQLQSLITTGDRQVKCIRLTASDVGLPVCQYLTRARSRMTAAIGFLCSSNNDRRIDHVIDQWKYVIPARTWVRSQRRPAVLQTRQRKRRRRRSYNDQRRANGDRSVLTSNKGSQTTKTLFHKV